MHQGTLFLNGLTLHACLLKFLFKGNFLTTPKMDMGNLTVFGTKSTYSTHSYYKIDDLTAFSKWSLFQCLIDSVWLSRCYSNQGSSGSITSNELEDIMWKRLPQKSISLGQCNSDSGTIIKNYWKAKPQRVLQKISSINWESQLSHKFQDDLFPLSFKYSTSA